MYSPQGYLVDLDVAAFRELARYFRDTDCASEATAQAIRSLGDSAVREDRKVVTGPGDIVVVPEVFFDPGRIAFYAQLLRTSACRVAFIIFDVLPLTHPWAFPKGTNTAFLDYASLVACCTNLAFISESTASAFHGRFGAGEAYAVLPLGSDALSRVRVDAKQLPEQPTFIAVGTIEPRKNHLLILNAFRQVWRRYPSVRLVFAGRMGWLDENGQQAIHRALAEFPQFSWRQHADDTTVAGLLLQSTASIFVSMAEGFGLPALESLWSGTPCIAGSTVPSVKALDGQGVHLLSSLNAESLAAAVERFLDAEYATTKMAEALSVPLPTWEEFGREAKAWVLSLPHGPSVRAEMLPRLGPRQPPPAPAEWRQRIKSLIPEPVLPAIRSARATARRLLRL